MSEIKDTKYIEIDQSDDYNITPTGLQKVNDINWLKYVPDYIFDNEEYDESIVYPSEYYKYDDYDTNQDLVKVEVGDINSSVDTFIAFIYKFNLKNKEKPNIFMNYLITADVYIDGDTVHFTCRYNDNYGMKSSHTDFDDEIIWQDNDEELFKRTVRRFDLPLNCQYIKNL